MNLIDAVNWRYATKRMNGKQVSEEKAERILKKMDDGVYKLTGDLTLLDESREVTMTMHHRGTTENPMADGAPVAGILITGEIYRSEFNLGNVFSPPMISNKVRIKADGEFMTH